MRDGDSREAISLTVHDATYDLLRRLGLTTVFGNPGSTEETFLADFPTDFTYVLGLHEASVVAMADGYAQATRQPALVNVHTAAGLGNAMGSVVAAFQGRTPLLITAGQQTREMLVHEPYLTNINGTEMPRPWVKWSYEPARAQDVPAALMRAYAMALQPPAGPVFVSVPFGDWAEPALGSAVARSVSRRIAPDPQRLREFADRIDRSDNPVVVFGDELDRAEGWVEGIGFAEKLQALVYGAPLPDRVSFPEDHPLYVGQLPMSIRGISDALHAHDLVIVVGGQVFRYYAYVAGPYLPEDASLLQLTSDPGHAASAPVGDSLLGDTRLALDQLADIVSVRTSTTPQHRTPRHSPDTEHDPPAPWALDAIYAALSNALPSDAVLVNEATSAMGQRREWLPVTRSGSYFSTPSGGLGWALPAAVGISLAHRSRGANVPVLVTIGDGSLQYSIQALWTAAQHGLPIVVVVLANNEYSVLKSFAHLEKATNVPGLDIPGLDVIAQATGFGVQADLAQSYGEIEERVSAGFDTGRPALVVVPARTEIADLG